MPEINKPAATHKTFHLGLCMAGSVSAGAYTAGVLDYLVEALANWERLRDNDPSLPDHRVVIDLVGGTSGGGMASAMAFYALRDEHLEPIRLNADRRTYSGATEKNIFWKAWVELTGGDVFSEMLQAGDIGHFNIPSLLNAGFIDKVAKQFEDYANRLGQGRPAPPYVNQRLELFLTLFNVTGIKYTLLTKGLDETGHQYAAEHRDLAHFRWSDEDEQDGRMELSFTARQNQPVLIAAAKATGAFPAGLKARIVERKAKYIWDNPFFTKGGSFNKESINLGKAVEKPGDLYRSINADGGVANNEPIELSRDLMMTMRIRQYRDVLSPGVDFQHMNDTDRMQLKRALTNSSVLLIDPFPALDFDITPPDFRSPNLLRYLPDLISGMRSQLLFDAKDALDAYKQKNYGLHIIAPSRDDVSRTEYAIACGALDGFGGLLHKEYRIHDYFLGRHNCQSFLRKYFVVNLDEPLTGADGRPNDDHACITAVLEGYRKKPEAIRRFGFENDKGRWVPVIPDVLMQQPITVDRIDTPQGIRYKYRDYNPEPTYRMQLPDADFLDQYRDALEERVKIIVVNLFDGGGIFNFIKKTAAGWYRDKIAGKVLDHIRKDLVKRKLVK